jgi:hypothetical integral membrane protein (TIGR02206 family)
MPLFGALHLTLLAAIAAACVALPGVLQSGRLRPRPVRLLLGWGLAINEAVWWTFRYWHEGWRFPHNLPLQLCDAMVWTAAIACLTLWRPAVEFGWFAGIAGAGMALLTPDLWSPWPSYPAVYFFVAHGGIVVAAAALVGGRIRPLERGAVWRAFSVLIAFASFVGAFNAVFGTNYMYLCRKPGSASLLDRLGPWPLYLVAGAAVTLAIFWVLWLPVRPVRVAGETPTH